MSSCKLVASRFPRDCSITDLSQLWAELESLGFSCGYKDGIVERNESGFTFDLIEYIKKDEFKGLPLFDSYDTLDTRQAATLERISRRKATQLIKEHKKGKPYPAHQYIDMARFTQDGSENWVEDLSTICYCAVCLGRLKQRYPLESLNLWYSRPTCSLAYKNLGYTSFATPGAEHHHVIQWADHHGMDDPLPFIQISGFSSGFCHYNQLYSHRHNHYLSTGMYEDTKELKKGMTNPDGEYITCCFLENTNKLTKQNLFLRAITGMFPYNDKIDDFVNDWDKMIFIANNILAAFAPHRFEAKSPKAQFLFLVDMLKIVNKMSGDMCTFFGRGKMKIIDDGLAHFLKSGAFFKREFGIDVFTLDDYDFETNAGKIEEAFELLAL